MTPYANIMSLFTNSEGDATLEVLAKKEGIEMGVRVDGKLALQIGPLNTDRQSITNGGARSRTF